MINLARQPRRRVDPSFTVTPSMMSPELHAAGGLGDDRVGVGVHSTSTVFFGRLRRPGRTVAP